MKQTFVVVINSDSEIEIGQIGVPIMDALGLESIKVEKVDEPLVYRDSAGVVFCKVCGTGLDVG